MIASVREQNYNCQVVNQQLEKVADWQCEEVEIMLRYERSLWLPLDAICSVELDIRLREWWNFDTLNGDTALTFDEWKLNFDDAWATLTEEQMGLRSLETIHASGKSMFIVELGTCTGLTPE